MVYCIGMKRRKTLIGIALVALLILGGTSLYFTLSPPVKIVQKPIQKQRKKLNNTVIKSVPPFNKHLYSLTDPASLWVIANKQHPLIPTSYAPSDLESVGNGQDMRAVAAQAFEKMKLAAATAGFTLTPDSGYRSYTYQIKTYESIAKNDGQAYADTVSSRAGYSEHQTGWALDIGTTGCHIDNCFGAMPAGQWTAAHAYEYGFLLRYPDDLTAITGYSHESWHFRYIGTGLSQEMHSEGIATLEQFFNVTGGTSFAQ